MKYEENAFWSAYEAVDYYHAIRTLREIGLGVKDILRLIMGQGFDPEQAARDFIKVEGGRVVPSPDAKDAIEFLWGEDWCGFSSSGMARALRRALGVQNEEICRIMMHVLNLPADEVAKGLNKGLGIPATDVERALAKAKEDIN